MNGNIRKQPANGAPISSHPAFPTVVALWFASLIGIGTLIVPATLWESLFSATGLSKILPGTTAPMSISARIALATIAAMGGAVVGLWVARKVMIAQGSETAAPRSEIGTDIGKASLAAKAQHMIAKLRSKISRTDDTNPASKAPMHSSARRSRVVGTAASMNSQGASAAPRTPRPISASEELGVASFDAPMTPRPGDYGEHSAHGEASPPPVHAPHSQHPHAQHDAAAHAHGAGYHPAEHHSEHPANAQGYAAQNNSQQSEQNHNRRRALTAAHDQASETHFGHVPFPGEQSGAPGTFADNNDAAHYDDAASEAHYQQTDMSSQSQNESAPAPHDHGQAHEAYQPQAAINTAQAGQDHSHSDHHNAANAANAANFTDYSSDGEMTNAMTAHNAHHDHYPAEPAAFPAHAAQNAPDMQPSGGEAAAPRYNPLGSPPTDFGPEAAHHAEPAPAPIPQPMAQPMAAPDPFPHAAPPQAAPQTAAQPQTPQAYAPPPAAAPAEYTTGAHHAQQAEPPHFAEPQAPSPSFPDPVYSTIPEAGQSFDSPPANGAANPMPEQYAPQYDAHHPAAAQNLPQPQGMAAPAPEAARPDALTPSERSALNSLALSELVARFSSALGHDGDNDPNNDPNGNGRSAPLPSPVEAASQGAAFTPAQVYGAAASASADAPIETAAYEPAPSADAASTPASAPESNEAAMPAAPAEASAPLNAPSAPPSEPTAPAMPQTYDPLTLGLGMEEDDNDFVDFDDDDDLGPLSLNLTQIQENSRLFASDSQNEASKEEAAIQDAGENAPETSADNADTADADAAADADAEDQRLAVHSPLGLGSGFVRVDEPDDMSAGDPAMPEPVIIFPGQAGIPQNGPAAAQTPPAATPEAPSAPQPAEQANPEDALRIALEKLQRMSGAA